MKTVQTEVGSEGIEVPAGTRVFEPVLVSKCKCCLDGAAEFVLFT